jgi:hypothetical protein
MKRKLHTALLRLEKQSAQKVLPPISYVDPRESRCGGEILVLPVSKSGLTIQILNPPCRLTVADFTEVALSSREIGVPENYLAHDLNRNAGSGRICGGMPSQVMWSQLSSGQLACFFYNKPCRCVRDREYPIAGFDPLVLDIFMQPICDPPRDEHNLSFSSALWSTEDKLLIDHIFRGERQNLSDSHSSPGHQFKYEPVSRFGCSKDDLVYCLFFDNVPVVRLSRPVQFPEHRRITGVLQA